MTEIFTSNWVVYSLEIMIVWAFFYYTYILIRGTRAVQVLKGLGFLVILTILSREIGWQFLSWVMDKLWTTFIIILVILFQPEIRRALARLGQRKLFRFYDEREAAKHVLGEVIKAVKKMSALRIGALIVFEGENSLKAVVDTGEIIDSRVSAETLQTIFSTNTPLHDGAVIIAEDRLVAARCILPLPPDDVEVDSQFGTRHRAAIGLSQETDACVVVVSEETGRISIVVQGKITTGFDDNALHEMLTVYSKTGDLKI